MAKFHKYLCCLDLTLATRLIGFFGLAVSILLTTVLISDKYGNNFHSSRSFALTLGLDWQHFHVNASHDADPEGTIISTIVIFYSVMYLITSMMLIYATVSFNRWLTVPWLSCELFGCTSKIVGMVFHAIGSSDNFSKLFIIGSTCYICIMLWWWVVVFVAQTTWVSPNNITFHFTLTPKPSISLSSHLEEESVMGVIRPIVQSNVTLAESPQPYEPNSKYSEI